MSPCVHVTTSWSRSPELDSLGFVTNGSEHTSEDGAWLSRPVYTCAAYQFGVAWLRRPDNTCNACMVCRWWLVAYQQRTARQLRTQKSRTVSAALLSPRLRSLACSARPWTAGLSRTSTSDHCPGV
eukprot:4383092-Amphidinium_carterae.1